jgi:hypothetical protein
MIQLFVRKSIKSHGRLGPGMAGLCTIYTKPIASTCIHKLSAAAIHWVVSGVIVFGIQMATKRKRIVTAGAVTHQTGTKRSPIWDYFNNDLQSQVNSWKLASISVLDSLHQDLFPTSRNAKSLMNISIGIFFPSCFVHRFDRLFEEEIPLPELVISWIHSLQGPQSPCTKVDN